MEEGFCAYVVLPGPVNFDSQIPKKGDQRQMESLERSDLCRRTALIGRVKGNKESWAG